MNSVLVEIADAINDQLGEECVQERAEDTEFQYETFKDTLNEMTANTMMTMLMAPEELPSIIFTCFLAGMDTYRDWMIERGVDVRALEGR